MITCGEVLAQTQSVQLSWLGQDVKDRHSATL